MKGDRARLIFAFGSTNKRLKRTNCDWSLLRQSSKLELAKIFAALQRPSLYKNTATLSKRRQRGPRTCSYQTISKDTLEHLPYKPDTAGLHIMGAAASKPAATSKALSLLSAVGSATLQGQLPDKSQSPNASDDLRDLAGYKTETRRFLDAHPGNRLYNGFKIYHKLHYRLPERAVARDFHNLRYIKARRQLSRNSGTLPDKSVIVDTSSTTVAHLLPLDGKAQDKVNTSALPQRLVTSEELPQGSNRHVPLLLPPRSDLLSICGIINGEPVRCLLDPACQSQLCDTRFARKYLALARLEHTWHIGSHHQGPHTPITECAQGKLDLGGHIEDLNCFVTDLYPGYDIVLGLPWFEMHNPNLDFITRTVNFTAHCHDSCTRSNNIEVRCDIKQGNVTVLSSPGDATPFKLLAMMARVTRSSARAATTRRSDRSVKIDSAPPIDGEREDSDEEGEGDDDFRDDDVQPTKGKKRTAPAKSKAPPKKRRNAVPKASTSTPLSQSAAQHLNIDNIDITLDDTTTVANRWINYINGHSVRERTGAKREYTPSYRQATHVLELQPWNPSQRLYELVEDQVALVPHVQPDGTAVKRWQILARNTMDTSSEEVELFLLPSVRMTQERCPHCISLGPPTHFTCDKKHPACGECAGAGRAAECAQERNAIEQRFAIMTSDVCSEKSQILKLGRTAVRVMNNAPFDLDLPAWANRVVTSSSPARSRGSVPQRFVTIVSLVRWKAADYKEFDFHSLPTLGDIGNRFGNAYGNPWSAFWLGSMLINHQGGKDWVTHQVPWTWNTDRNEAWIGMTRAVPNSGIDTTAVGAVDFNAKDYPFLGAATEADGYDDNQKAYYKLVQMCFYQLVGYVGDRAAIVQKLQDIKQQYYTTTTRPANQSGPFNGSKIWGMQTKHGWVNLVPTAEVLRNLEVDGVDCSKLKVRTPEFKEMLASLTIKTTITDEACLAWIAQKSLDALAKGEELLQILLAAVVAAQRLELGTLTKQQVLESLCSCENASDEAHTEHYCTSCWNIRVCSRLSKEAGSDGVLLKCSGCSGRTFSSKGRFNVQSLVMASAKNQETTDKKAHSIDWTAKNLYNSLLETHATDKEDVWLDGYTGTQVSLRDALWPPQYRRSGFMHPRALSIEKPFSRWVRGDGTLSLHDPAGNAILTKGSYNILKGNNAPSALPLIKKALQLRLHTADRPPCEGYYPEVAVDWNLLEHVSTGASHIECNASDSIQAFHIQRVISRLAPFALHERVKAGQNIDEVRKMISMERSGVWDGTTIGRQQIRDMFVSQHQGRMLKHPNFSYNDQYWDWTVILKDIEQMQNDVRPDGFNPYGLELPRCGKNKIPWVWATNLCPDDSDYDDKYIFDEFSCRLYTMDFKCDREHKTEESPATLFLEYIAQWFQRGGKCHIFGFIMNPFVGHLARYSLGRGITEMRRVEDGGPRAIKAGDHLRTGCKTLLPRNMAKDYDVARRTVIVESWLANKLRWDYPNIPGLIETLEGIILELQDSCKWYAALSTSLNDYKNISVPTMKNQSDWRAAMRAQTSTLGGDDEPFEETVDEEVAAYEERANEVESMKAAAVSKSIGEEYLRLRAAAEAIGCDFHKSVVDLLAQLSTISAEGDSETEPSRAIVEELEDYMQKVVDGQESTDPEKLGAAPSTSRREMFQHHLEKLRSIEGFLPAPLQQILDAINARLPANDGEFLPQEAFGYLWELGVPINIG